MVLYPSNLPAIFACYLTRCFGASQFKQIILCGDKVVFVNKVLLVLLILPVPSLPVPVSSLFSFFFQYIHLCCPFNFALFLKKNY